MKTRAKLPKLVLPKFRGVTTEWQTFWDSFNSSIHVNPHLSPIDKFNQLHSLLEGQAAHAIQGLPRTHANYQSAAALIASVNEGTRPSPDGAQIKCAYCRGGHYSVSCDVVTDLQAHLEILQEIKDVLFACDSVIKAVPVVWSVGVAKENIISPCVAKRIHRESHLTQVSIHRTRGLL